MKKSFKKVYLLVLVISTFFACTKDFIVKDIKNDTVKIIAPADNLKVPNNGITFWWEELDGAEKYNIQIVKPSFASVQQLLVDTNVIGNKYYHTFTPGVYQWRIKAVNSGGSTVYTIRTLTIDTTSNLNLVTIGLISPANNLVTASNSIVFSWNPIAAADYYELKITNTVTNSVTTISNIFNNNYSYNFATLTGSEEHFDWQVKAFNSFSQTQTNTLRSFKIDHKAPFLATILSPNSYSISLRDTTYLKWNRNVLSNDIEYEVVSISSDSLFLSILGSQHVSNNSPIRINAIYGYSNTPIQVWWRVNSIDSVGNASIPSQSKRFYIY